ncbi:MAG: hypothetical protein ACRD2J_04340 [Thermoanaerobaculia bacterium]
MEHLVANAKTKVEAVPLSFALPVVLALNTLALLLLEAHHAVPGWIKNAASLLLLF